MARQAKRYDVETNSYEPVHSFPQSDGQSNDTTGNENSSATTRRVLSRSKLEGGSGFTTHVGTERGDLPEGAANTAVLASAFESAVQDSAAFSWIGVILRSERFERPMVDVYLSEREIAVTDRGLMERVTSVVDLFDELALSLEPSLTASLHLVRDSDLPPIGLQNEIIHLCATSATHTLLWHTPL